MQFTQKGLESLKAPSSPDGEYMRLDGRGSSSAGWLASRVRNSKGSTRKQFMFVYMQDGKRRKMMLGELGDPRYGRMTLAKARDRYENLSGEVMVGKYPLAEREARKRETAEKQAQGSFAALCTAYVDSLKAKGAASAGEVERNLTIAQETIPGKLPASEVTVDHVCDAMRAALRGRRKNSGAKRGSESREQANRMRSYLLAAFTYGLAYGLSIETPKSGPLKFGLTQNPARDVPKVPRPGQSGIRDIELTAEEIALLWRTLPNTYEHEGKTIRVRPDHQTALKLLLAIGGQRVKTVTEAKWSEIDLDKALWTVPRARCKNSNPELPPHLIPLNPLAVELLRELKARLTAGEASLPEHVFPAPRKGETPFLQFKSLQQAVQRWIKASGFPKWFAPRDIRQTFMTLGGEVGLSSEIRNRIHDRLPQNIGTKHYDRYDYINEKRKALDAWGDRLSQIIAGAKVTPIGSAKKA